MSNYISPSARLIGNVQLGDGNFIGDNCLVIGPISIGNNNHFSAGVIVGMIGQDDFESKDSHDRTSLGKSDLTAKISIGSNNTFREYSTVHRGIAGETVVGNYVYVMTYSNISHNSTIYDDVKIASNVQMGGYASVCRGAYLGMNATIHQFTTIGAYSMVGMGSVVTRDVSTAIKAFGSPCREVGPNVIGLQRLGISEFDWWESRDFDSADNHYGTELKKQDLIYLSEIIKRSNEMAYIREMRMKSR